LTIFPLDFMPIMRQTKLILLLIFPLLSLFGVITCNSQNLKSDRNPFHLVLTQTQDDYRRQIAENQAMEMIDLTKRISDIVIDIRYATPNNFTHKVIYTSAKAFVRKPVAEALQKVQDSLLHYKLGLKIYDAYRPYAATLRFYKVYPDSNFVANPRHGSHHNRGCAVDITLAERESGKEIPMPSEFDDFSAKANPEYADLPDTVIANRKLLFGVMSHFGFKHISTEWWHFDFTGWEKYPLMDLSFEELEKAAKE
jgi:zinc D-Ala-D-Ala dipeptidase